MNYEPNQSMCESPICPIVIRSMITFRGLFQQMIIHSGSPYSKWSTNDKVVDMSRDLAKILNCPIKDSDALKRCMKDLDLEDIMEAASEFPLARDDLAFLTYNPRLDGDFLYSDHEEMMADAPQIPTIIGFNKHEGIFLTVEIPNSVLAFRSSLTVDTDEIPNYDKTTLEQFIKGPGAQILGSQLNQAEVDKIVKAAIGFYAHGNSSSSEDYKHYLKQYTYVGSDSPLFHNISFQLISDLGFIVPLMREARGSFLFVFFVSLEFKTEATRGRPFSYLNSTT